MEQQLYPESHLYKQGKEQEESLRASFPLSICFPFLREEPAQASLWQANF